MTPGCVGILAAPDSLPESGLRSRLKGINNDTMIPSKKYSATNTSTRFLQRSFTFLQTTYVAVSNCAKGDGGGGEKNLVNPSPSPHLHYVGHVSREPIIPPDDVKWGPPLPPPICYTSLTKPEGPKLSSRYILISVLWSTFFS